MAMKTQDIDMPSEVSGKLSLFDRFASTVSSFTSRAWFFTLCLLSVLLWAPSILLIQDMNTWQLLINSMTTIVTFLLVALLQNTQSRANAALQHKLNALAEGMATLMSRLAEAGTHERLADDVRELRAAVGLEDKEST